MNRRDGRKRILLLEERGALRNLIRKVLEDAGYCVTVGSDPREELTRMKGASVPVDLVILDTTGTPGPDRDLGGEIRRLNPDCPIVLVSGREGSNLPGTEPDWLRTVPRPVKLSELFEAVESLVGPESGDGSDPDDDASPRRDRP